MCYTTANARSITITMYVDVPAIISGTRIGYFDPQKEIWSEAGKSYQLSKVAGTDHLILLQGIAGFSACEHFYGKTLFRFPLRTAASKLSENLHSVGSVLELTEALKSDAELLLLFLCSVHTIAVHSIDQQGVQRLLFEVKVAENCVERVQRARTSLLEELQSCHASDSYNISNVMQFTEAFDVHVFDGTTNKKCSSSWLVSNCVGSSDPAVIKASKEQKVFPWVGTAIRLENPGNGRIFCFLPMPAEARSNLPVHVNGTFGLSDDRRSLKWPGIERTHDPAAEWNRTLVSELIPPCYVTLLLASRDLMIGPEFYKAWPDVCSLQDTQWEPLLSKLFSVLLREEVIFCEAVGGWISPRVAVFEPEGSALCPVVLQVLSHCQVKLAGVPPSVRDAIRYVGVSVEEVSPALARKHICPRPDSYVSIAVADKHSLLEYCLSDANYKDLVSLQLLPLCNGAFTAFQLDRDSDPVYLCTSECQRELVPGLDEKLVNLPFDSSLYAKLEAVAKSSITQLSVLSIADLPGLISESLPAEWQNKSSIPFPMHSTVIPSSWFQIFWSWVQDQPLAPFAENFILPVLGDNMVEGCFNIVKLATRPNVYLAENLAYTNIDLDILRKFGIFCCPQKFKCFELVTHKELKDYTESFDSPGILRALSYVSSAHRQKVILSEDEASRLRTILNMVKESEGLSKYQHVLSDLRIFTSASNTGNHLYSVHDLCQESLLKASIAVENSDNFFDISVLPRDVIILACDDSFQKQLLLTTTTLILRVANFLTSRIFPLMKDMKIPDRYFDAIMVKVLDNFDALKSYDHSIPVVLNDLPFVTTSSGVRKSPKVLYDPDKEELRDIFYNTSLFPSAPYDKAEYISALRICGLCAAVSPQGILDRIDSMSKDLPQPVDDEVFTCVEVDREMHACAKAIMAYIGQSVFQTDVTCSLPREFDADSVSFSEALEILSTKRCWLPILATPPDNYPSQLPWKGREYSSHLCGLGSHVSISKASFDTLPRIYGSQVYFTLYTNVLSSDISPSHLVGHLQSVIQCASTFTPAELISILGEIYSAMLEALDKAPPGSDNPLVSLRSVERWIYVGNSNFVSPAEVALKENPSFPHCHSLEPYLYLLPESIANYQEIFTHFGVAETMSQEQIISVLPSLRSDISNQSIPESFSVSACWEMVKDILKWLADDQTKMFVVPSDSLYVPIESTSDWPDLEPASEVVYTDNEFLKKFLETDKPLKFVHHQISTSLAESLQLTPLSKELDIAGDTFEDIGQHEPLTTRLKNILRDYKDGLTIVKELIQNADDAEATEVNILFDARTHCQDVNELFFQGMAQSHGPALVVHNNKAFSEEDFQNITKLAGATKEGKHLKIGKFGVGFCSVYHITDVPSFVSRDRLSIFDPTLRHLGKEIKNPAQPGKKLQFTSKVIRNSRQLEPYHDLFGFKQSQAYDGTIFRLPFRTSTSELSETRYTESTVLELLDDINSCCDNLILFLQHVQTITFQRINSGDSSPVTLFSVSKENFPLSPLEGVSAISIDSKKGSESKDRKWLVSQNTSYEGKYATASVACKLVPSQSPVKYSIHEVLKGEVFCYLPLAQSTGLPVHVSCNFAVINNRRGIWTMDESASLSSETEVEWNICLMEGTIPRAYLNLLNALKDLQTRELLESYSFHDLWPLTEDLKLQNPWSKFITKLYSLLSKSELFYSESLEEWKSITDGRFLEPNIFKSPNTPTCVLDVLVHLQIPLINLPHKFQGQFDFGASLIDQPKFIDIFFADLQDFGNIFKSRNDVMTLMLEMYANKPELTDILERRLSRLACIPSSPTGVTMKKCDELIHPEAKFACLYNPDESMFPLQDLVERPLCDAALKKLHVINQVIPWKYVLERAMTVQSLALSDFSLACERAKHIIEAITDHTSDSPNDAPPDSLSQVPFLPVMKKPANFKLHWPGDREGITLSSGTKSLLAGRDSVNVMLAGSRSIFVCEDTPENGGCGRISAKVRKILGLKTVPPVSAVVEHFVLIVNQAQDLTPDWVGKACTTIYSHLNSELSKECITDSDLEQLHSLPCIWTGTEFVSANEVCMEWSLKGPYLYKVPEGLLSKEKLCSALSIKERFSLDDIKNALIKMKAYFGLACIDESCLRIFNQLVPLLQAETLEDSNLLLPSEGNVLHYSKDLAYNDAPWISLDTGQIYVNEIFSRQLAKDLGVKFVRSKFLEQYSSVHGFKSFGQKETLTRRIRNILRDYPLDVTLLKELLQNADDAKATKMCVILDKRSHGTERVLSEEWSKLQGPALLVWNDSIFSEKDLEGIQELGLGSKRAEADSIGQYGIGFNVVYHITDCPSFISNDEIMCIMDPHCQYAPGASELHGPGARYDNVNDGFWQNFPDLQSAYLRTGLSNRNILDKGSLFRFPIRHDKCKSEIADGAVDGTGAYLSANNLGDKLQDWMSKMKEAVLFVNNVTELQYLVIEETGNQMETVFHFKSEIGEPALADRSTLQGALSDFKQVTGCKSHIITYPLTLSSSHPKGTEQWLIQQGVGDIHNEGRKWTYVKNVKPRHGIAAPLPRAGSVVKKDFRGQVFCFLPLPVESGFPVHVNGHFILDSNRRGLWSCTSVDDKDERSEWNDNLIQALASSYADFLVRAKEHYVLKEYTNMHTVISVMQDYYSLFPVFSASLTERSHWSTLAQRIYKLIVEHNHHVFCVLESAGDRYNIKWLPARSSSPASQVYYWPAENYASPVHRDVYPILERIGMKITPAPAKVMDCFKTACELKFFPASRKSIFKYYTQFSTFSAKVMRVTRLEDTAFRDIESFLTFTKYLLSDSSSSQHGALVSIRSTSEVAQRRLTYPDPPFNHYLLLTADGMLRAFDDGKKILHSRFSDLFPNSLYKFLHPDLLSVDYTENYFLQPSFYVGDCYADNFILDILERNLPQQLKSASIEDPDVVSNLISRRQLTALWECFQDDIVFSTQVSNMLKHWALLPSQDGRLFSATSNVHPVFQSSSQAPANPQMLNVLKAIRMPFLDTTVVRISIDSSICPPVSNGQKILSNLYHINQQTPIITLLEEDDIKVIISYLEDTDVTSGASSQKEVIKHVKSLPLFENIDGSYTAICNRSAYVWPGNACDVAYKKWLEGSSAVFLKRSRKWSQIAGSLTAQLLSVREISVAKLYTKFIFANFAKMDSRERCQHLEFIKDNLHVNMKHDAMNELNEERWEEATSFLEGLKQLQCIGQGRGPLRRIQDFGDHTVEIFNTFPDNFIFLPDEFHDEDDWLPFLRDLGLRRKVSRSEFLQFCREVAISGQTGTGDCRYCSSVLLDCLFNQYWGQDCSGFLREVSEISFILQERLPELEWVLRGACPGGQMVKLRGSAPLSHATLVWTVKPVISLPESTKTDMLADLGMSETPVCDDVFANIVNICTKSDFAQQCLFMTYPPLLFPPKDSKNTLLCIMAENLKCLGQPEVDFDCSQLNSLPCVPVCSTIGPQEKSKTFVLVKPCQVIHEQWDKSSVQQFHPFLHCLPDVTELHSCTNLLKAIGVMPSLEPHHIQIVLEGAHQVSEGAELDPNIKMCVKRAIKFLSEKLSQVETTSGGELSPLYLPDTENILRDTKSLLYGDTINYGKKLNLDLQDVPYHHFNIKTSDYNAEAAKFCRLLPDSVRPLGMSSICKQVVLEPLDITEPSDVAEQLTNVLKLEELSTGVVRFLDKYFGNQENEDHLKELVTEYLCKIEVLTVVGLKVTIVLSELGKQIGTLDTKYCYNPGEEKSMFYLDSNLRQPMYDDSMYEDIATNLRDTVCKDMKEEGLQASLQLSTEFLQVIKTCLKVSSVSDILDILSEHDIDVETRMRQFNKRLGEVIPQCWHHRLDQDIDNLFNPMEYVGYAREGSSDIIVAQIVYPVAPEDDNSGHLLRKYRVYMREDDDEGIDVSILSLYKFIPGRKKPQLQPAPGSDDQSVVLFDEDDELPRLRNYLIEEDLVEILQRICNQLRQIWELPEELRKRALKRLFLTWHPDKNDDPDKAEIVFKFLMKQIEHLEKVEPLDDPTAGTEARAAGTSGFYPSGGQRRRGRRCGRWYHHYNSR